MMELETLKDLKRRVDEATGPSYDLDADIFNTLKLDGERLAYPVTDKSKFTRWHCGWFVGRSQDEKWPDDLPSYTASIDASLALVESKLPGCGWFMTSGRESKDEPLYAASLYPIDKNGLHASFTDDQNPISETDGGPALAILSALISALIKEREDA